MNKKKVLSKCMILSWATSIAVLGCTWPAGRGLDPLLGVRQQRSCIPLPVVLCLFIFYFVICLLRFMIFLIHSLSLEFLFKK